MPSSIHPHIPSTTRRCLFLSHALRLQCIHPHSPLLFPLISSSIRLHSSLNPSITYSTPTIQHSTTHSFYPPFLLSAFSPYRHYAYHAFIHSSTHSFNHSALPFPLARISPPMHSSTLTSPISSHFIIYSSPLIPQSINHLLHSHHPTLHYSFILPSFPPLRLFALPPLRLPCLHPFIHTFLQPLGVAFSSRTHFASNAFIHTHLSYFLSFHHLPASTHPSIHQSPTPLPPSNTPLLIHSTLLSSSPPPFRLTAITPTMPSSIHPHIPSTTRRCLFLSHAFRLQCIHPHSPLLFPLISSSTHLHSSLNPSITYSTPTIQHSTTHSFYPPFLLSAFSPYRHYAYHAFIHSSTHSFNHSALPFPLARISPPMHSSTLTSPISSHFIIYSPPLIPQSINHLLHSHHPTLHYSFILPSFPPLHLFAFPPLRLPCLHPFIHTFLQPLGVAFSSRTHFASNAFIHTHLSYFLSFHHLLTSTHPSIHQSPTPLPPSNTPLLIHSTLLSSSPPFRLTAITPTMPSSIHPHIPSTTRRCLFLSHAFRLQCIHPHSPLPFLSFHHLFVLHSSLNPSITYSTPTIQHSTTHSFYPPFLLSAFSPYRHYAYHAFIHSSTHSFNHSALPFPLARISPPMHSSTLTSPISSHFIIYPPPLIPQSINHLLHSHHPTLHYSFILPSFPPLRLFALPPLRLPCLHPFIHTFLQPLGVAFSSRTHFASNAFIHTHLSYFLSFHHLPASTHPSIHQSPTPLPPSNTPLLIHSTLLSSSPPFRLTAITPTMPSSIHPHIPSTTRRCLFLSHAFRLQCIHPHSPLLFPLISSSTRLHSSLNPSITYSTPTIQHSTTHSFYPPFLLSAFSPYRHYAYHAFIHSSTHSFNHSALPFPLARISPPMHSSTLTSPISSHFIIYPPPLIPQSINHLLHSHHPTLHYSFILPSFPPPPPFRLTAITPTMPSSIHPHIPSTTRRCLFLSHAFRLQCIHPHSPLLFPLISSSTRLHSSLNPSITYSTPTIQHSTTHSFYPPFLLSAFSPYRHYAYHAFIHSSTHSFNHSALPFPLARISPPMHSSTLTSPISSHFIIYPPPLIPQSINHLLHSHHPTLHYSFILPSFPPLRLFALPPLRLPCLHPFIHTFLQPLGVAFSSRTHFASNAFIHTHLSYFLSFHHLPASTHPSIHQSPTPLPPSNTPLLIHSTLLSSSPPFRLTAITPTMPSSIHPHIPSTTRRCLFLSHAFRLQCIHPHSPLLFPLISSSTRLHSSLNPSITYSTPTIQHSTTHSFYPPFLLLPFRLTAITPTMPSSIHPHIPSTTRRCLFLSHAFRLQCIHPHSPLLFPLISSSTRLHSSLNPSITYSTPTIQHSTTHSFYPPFLLSAFSPYRHYAYHAFIHSSTHSFNHSALPFLSRTHFASNAFIHTHLSYFLSFHHLFVSTHPSIHQSPTPLPPSNTPLLIHSTLLSSSPPFSCYRHYAYHAFIHSSTHSFNHSALPFPLARISPPMHSSTLTSPISSHFIIYPPPLIPQSINHLLHSHHPTLHYSFILPSFPPLRLFALPPLRLPCLHPFIHTFLQPLGVAFSSRTHFASNAFIHTHLSYFLSFHHLLTSTHPSIHQSPTPLPPSNTPLLIHSTLLSSSPPFRLTAITPTMPSSIHPHIPSTTRRCLFLSHAFRLQCIHPHSPLLFPLISSSTRLHSSLNPSITYSTPTIQHSTTHSFYPPFLLSRLFALPPLRLPCLHPFIHTFLQPLGVAFSSRTHFASNAFIHTHLSYFLSFHHLPASTHPSIHQSPTPLPPSNTPLLIHSTLLSSSPPFFALPPLRLPCLHPFIHTFLQPLGVAFSSRTHFASNAFIHTHLSYFLSFHHLPASTHPSIHQSPTPLPPSNTPLLIHSTLLSSSPPFRLTAITPTMPSSIHPHIPSTTRRCLFPLARISPPMHSSTLTSPISSHFIIYPPPLIPQSINHLLHSHHPTLHYSFILPSFPPLRLFALPPLRLPCLHPFIHTFLQPLGVAFSSRTHFASNAFIHTHLSYFLSFHHLPASTHPSIHQSPTPLPPSNTPLLIHSTLLSSSSPPFRLTAITPTMPSSIHPHIPSTTRRCLFLSHAFRLQCIHPHSPLLFPLISSSTRLHSSLNPSITYSTPTIQHSTTHSFYPPFLLSAFSPYRHYAYHAFIHSSTHSFNHSALPFPLARISPPMHSSTLTSPISSHFIIYPPPLIPQSINHLLHSHHPTLHYSFILPSFPPLRLFALPPLRLPCLHPFIHTFLQPLGVAFSSRTHFASNAFIHTHLSYFLSFHHLPASTHPSIHQSPTPLPPSNTPLLIHSTLLSSSPPFRLTAITPTMPSSIHPHIPSTTRRCLFLSHAFRLQCIHPHSPLLFPLISSSTRLHSSLNPSITYSTPTIQHSTTHSFYPPFLLSTFSPYRHYAYHAFIHSSTHSFNHSALPFPLARISPPMHSSTLTSPISSHFIIYPSPLIPQSINHLLHSHHPTLHYSFILPSFPPLRLFALPPLRLPCLHPFIHTFLQPLGVAFSSRTHFASNAFIHTHLSYFLSFHHLPASTHPSIHQSPTPLPPSNTPLLIHSTLLSSSPPFSPYRHYAYHAFIHSSTHSFNHSALPFPLSRTHFASNAFIHTHLSYFLSFHHLPASTHPSIHQSPTPLPPSNTPLLIHSTLLSSSPPFRLTAITPTMPSSIHPHIPSTTRRCLFPLARISPPMHSSTLTSPISSHFIIYPPPLIPQSINHLLHSHHPTLHYSFILPSFPPLHLFALPPLRLPCLHPFIHTFLQPLGVAFSSRTHFAPNAFIHTHLSYFLSFHHLFVSTHPSIHQSPTPLPPSNTPLLIHSTLLSSSPPFFPYRHYAYHAFIHSSTHSFNHSALPFPLARISPPMHSSTLTSPISSHFIIYSPPLIPQSINHLLHSHHPTLHYSFILPSFPPLRLFALPPLRLPCLHPFIHTFLQPLGVAFSSRTHFASNAFIHTHLSYFLSFHHLFVSTHPSIHQSPTPLPPSNTPLLIHSTLLSSSPPFRLTAITPTMPSSIHPHIPSTTRRCLFLSHAFRLQCIHPHSPLLFPLISSSIRLHSSLNPSITYSTPTIQHSTTHSFYPPFLLSAFFSLPPLRLPCLHPFIHTFLQPLGVAFSSRTHFASNAFIHTHLSYFLSFHHLFVSTHPSIHQSPTPLPPSNTPLLIHSTLLSSSPPFRLTAITPTMPSSIHPHIPSTTRRCLFLSHAFRLQCIHPHSPLLFPLISSSIPSPLIPQSINHLLHSHHPTLHYSFILPSFPPLRLFRLTAITPTMPSSIHPHIPSTTRRCLFLSHAFRLQCIHPHSPLLFPLISSSIRLHSSLNPSITYSTPTIQHSTTHSFYPPFLLSAFSPYRHYAYHAFIHSSTHSFNHSALPFPLARISPPMHSSTLTSPISSHFIIYSSPHPSIHQSPTPLPPSNTPLLIHSTLLSSSPPFRLPAITPTMPSSIHPHIPSTTRRCLFLSHAFRPQCIHPHSPLLFPLISSSTRLHSSLNPSITYSTPTIQHSTTHSFYPPFLLSAFSPYRHYAYHAFIHSSTHSFNHSALPFPLARISPPMHSSTLTSPISSISSSIRLHSSLNPSITYSTPTIQHSTTHSFYPPFLLSTFSPSRHYAYHAFIHSSTHSFNHSALPFPLARISPPMHSSTLTSPISSHFIIYSSPHIPQSINHLLHSHHPTLHYSFILPSFPPLRLFALPPLRLPCLHPFIHTFLQPLGVAFSSRTHFASNAFIHTHLSYFLSFHHLSVSTHSSIHQSPTPLPPSNTPLLIHSTLLSSSPPFRLTAITPTMPSSIHPHIPSTTRRCLFLSHAFRPQCIHPHSPLLFPLISSSIRLHSSLNPSITYSTPTIQHSTTHSFYPPFLLSAFSPYRHYAYHAFIHSSTHSFNHSALPFSLARISPPMHSSTLTSPISSHFIIYSSPHIPQSINHLLHSHHPTLHYSFILPSFPPLPPFRLTAITPTMPSSIHPHIPSTTRRCLFLSHAFRLQCIHPHSPLLFPLISSSIRLHSFLNPSITYSTPTIQHSTTHSFYPPFLLSAFSPYRHYAYHAFIHSSTHSFNHSALPFPLARISLQCIHPHSPLLFPLISSSTRLHSSLNPSITYSTPTIQHSTTHSFYPPFSSPLFRLTAITPTMPSSIHPHIPSTTRRCLFLSHAFRLQCIHPHSPLLFPLISSSTRLHSSLNPSITYSTPTIQHSTTHSFYPPFLLSAFFALPPLRLPCLHPFIHTFLQPLGVAFSSRTHFASNAFIHTHLSYFLSFHHLLTSTHPSIHQSPTPLPPSNTPLLIHSTLLSSSPPFRLTAITPTMPSSIHPHIPSTTRRCLFLSHAFRLQCIHPHSPLLFPLISSSTRLHSSLNPSITYSTPTIQHSTTHSFYPPFLLSAFSPYRHYAYHAFIHSSTHSFNHSALPFPLARISPPMHSSTLTSPISSHFIIYPPPLIPQSINHLLHSHHPTLHYSFILPSFPPLHLFSFPAITPTMPSSIHPHIPSTTRRCLFLSHALRPQCIHPHSPLLFPLISSSIRLHSSLNPSITYSTPTIQHSTTHSFYPPFLLSAFSPYRHYAYHAFIHSSTHSFNHSAFAFFSRTHFAPNAFIHTHLSYFLSFHHLPASTHPSIHQSPTPLPPSNTPLLIHSTLLSSSPPFRLTAITPTMPSSIHPHIPSTTRRCLFLSHAFRPQCIHPHSPLLFPLISSSIRLHSSLNPSITYSTPTIQHSTTHSFYPPFLLSAFSPYRHYAYHAFIHSSTHSFNHSALPFPLARISPPMHSCTLTSPISSHFIIYPPPLIPQSINHLLHSHHPTLHYSFILPSFPPLRLFALPPLRLPCLHPFIHTFLQPLGVAFSSRTHYAPNAFIHTHLSYFLSFHHLFVSTHPSIHQSPTPLPPSNTPLLIHSTLLSSSPPFRLTAITPTMPSSIHPHIRPLSLAIKVWRMSKMAFWVQV
ncbi:hypothetical protein TcWFU_007870 [Taenia crassiceps]|uniref:Uncharacterized protein n=1 Tax=Taenia crassiceps TaxID=6207 RepID=A0ABR4Q8F9_9CEST